MGKYLSWKLFPGEDFVSLRQIFIERIAENDRRAYLETMKSFVGWSVRDRINQITVPTLVIASEHDYTPVSSKEAFVDRMPQAELTVIENAHHAVPAQYPEHFNAVLAAFLSGLS